MLFTLLFTVMCFPTLTLLSPHSGKLLKSRRKACGALR
nr:MAG TPA: hypothetical protein [Bacteriophage sp.]